MSTTYPSLTDVVCPSTMPAGGRKKPAVRPSPDSTLSSLENVGSAFRYVLSVPLMLLAPRLWFPMF